MNVFLRRGVLVVAFMLTTELAWAQTTPRLLAGTRLRVRLDTNIATKSARPGDGVEATLIESIEKDRRIVLPQGSRLVGRVEDVRSADRRQALVAQVRVTFTEVRVASKSALPTSASILEAGSDQKVDAKGLVTTAKHKDVSTSLEAGSFFGGLIGLLVARTEKALIVGAIVGASLMGLGELGGSGPEWDDFELKRGHKLWVRLDADTVVP